MPVCTFPAMLYYLYYCRLKTCLMYVFHYVLTSSFLCFPDDVIALLEQKRIESKKHLRPSVCLQQLVLQEVRTMYTRYSQRQMAATLALASQVAQEDASDIEDDDDEMDNYTDCFYSYAGRD